MAARVRLGTLVAAAALAATGHASGRGNPPADPSPPVVVRVSDGFHWGDAAIGAAAMLGLVLLVASLRRVAAVPAFTDASSGPHEPSKNAATGTAGPVSKLADEEPADEWMTDKRGTA